MKLYNEESNTVDQLNDNVRRLRELKASLKASNKQIVANTLQLKERRNNLI